MTKWEKTNEGRLSIYYLAIELVNVVGENAYILNDDAKLGDSNDIIDFLRQLIILEWIGD